jgi:serine/threonine protein kinase
MFKLCMVSEWMPQGNISDYVATHPDADRTSLVSTISLCIDVAHHEIWNKLKDVGKGLQYLHKCQIVHGDLKGARIQFFQVINLV